MSSAQRRYLLGDQGVGAAAFNAVLNAGIAWLVFHRLAWVPLAGDMSIAGDTIVTGMLLPLLTCLIVTPVARRHVQAGRLAALGWTRASHPVLGWLPKRTWQRGLVLGVAGVVLMSVPTVALLGALGVTGMPLGRFVLFKATFAGLAALVVTPAIALWAIAPAPAQGDAIRRGSVA